MAKLLLGVFMLVMLTCGSIFACTLQFSKAQSTIPNSFQEPPAVEWSRTYGPMEGYWVAQTSDGGYIIAGRNATWFQASGHATSGWTNFTSLLVKTDAQGRMQWGRTYNQGGFAISYAWCAVQTQDGGYALAGYKSGGAFYLAKTDAEGSIIWDAHYLTEDIGMCIGLSQTADGGYALAGPAHPAASSEDATALVRVDGNGGVLWNRTYDIGSHGMLSAFVQAADGGYALAGGNQLIITDPKGNLQYNRTFGRIGNDQLLCIAEAPDGFLLAGSTYDAYNTSAWIVKTDRSGALSWERKIELSDRYSIRSIALLKDGGFTTVGLSAEGVVVSRFSTDGELIWQKVLEGTAQNTPRHVIKSSDGGIVVVGNSMNATLADQNKHPFAFYENVWMLKLAPESSPNPTPSPTISASTTPTQSPTPIQSTTPAQSLNPEPTLSPTATVSEFPMWTILPLAIVMALTAVITFKRKNQRRS